MILSTFQVDTINGALSIFPNVVSIVVCSRRKVDPALSVVCFWNLCEGVIRPGSQTVFHSREVTQSTPDSSQRSCSGCGL